jgi:phosphoribosylglycinamide formyltransferase-1
VRAVISSRPDAAGLEWARTQGITTRVVDHRQFASREEFDRSLAAVIDEHAPQLILLAGFMRIFTEGFIRKYPRRIVNIHPSLLPSFPGLHTHRQALAAGVKVHGATVHVVTAALDNGPVIIQGTVPVIPGDTEEALAERVLAVEHRIYPQAVRWFVEGRIEFVAGDVVHVRGTGVAGDTMVSPRNIE